MRSERLIGLVFVLLGAAMLGIAFPLWMPVAGSGTRWYQSPRLLPTICVGVVVLVGVVEVVRGHGARIGGRALMAAALAHGRAVALVLAMLVFVTLVGPRAGMIVAVPAMCLALMWLRGVRAPLRLLVAGILVPSAALFAMVHLGSVPLPLFPKL